MYKFYFEEIGLYSIKYDGFRKHTQYTLLDCASNRLGEFETRSQCLAKIRELLKLEGRYVIPDYKINVKVDRSFHDPNEPSKFYLAKYKKTNSYVCVLFEYNDNVVLASSGSDENEEEKLLILNKDELEL